MVNHWESHCTIYTIMTIFINYRVDSLVHFYFVQFHNAMYNYEKLVDLTYRLGLPVNRA